MKEVCIVYAGTKFSTDYVVQKRRQLDKYCTKATRLTVLTDDPAAIVGLGLRDTRAVLLPNWQLTGRQLWWYKVYMFSRAIDWMGPVLYVDLDTIIIADIVHLYKYEQASFMILQDFNRAFIDTYPISNSSVMRFDPRDHHDICEYFEDNREQIIRKFRGDQDYLTDWFKRIGGSAWWPRQWCMSYKWEIVHGGSRRGGPDLEHPRDYYQPDVPWVIPTDCCVVVFHGQPMMSETEFGTQYRI